MKIAKIIRVVDTREYTEEGDRWVPIPGSGTENQCARCGRLHEVHATVELVDGSNAIVGTGCMKAESLDIQSNIKRLTSASKRQARLMSQMKCLSDLIAERKRIEHEVTAMHLPASREEKTHCTEKSGYEYDKFEIVFSDGVRFCSLRELTKTSYQEAARAWYHQKERELGMTYAHERAVYDLKTLDEKLCVLEDKFPELKGEPR
jgi:hypothetical protein